MAEEKERTDEDKLKEQFTSDLGESKQYMEPIQQRMDRDYEVYRNFRYTDDLDFKKSDLFEYVETVVPIVTNNRIRGSVRSDYPNYVTHAKGLNDILDHTYDVNNWDYQSQYIMRMALIYRSSFAYTGYDEKYKNNTGKLCIEPVNSRWCYVDPAAVELDDSRFFFYVQPMRKTQVIALHPDKKDEIKKAVAKQDQPDWKGTKNGSNGWFKTWINSMRSALAFDKNVTKARRVYDYDFMPEMGEDKKYQNSIAYIHYWYRDDEDNWRKSCWANDTMLSDEANPFWHGKLPYDIFSPVKDPLSMMGVPISEQIENMSVNRNMFMNYYIRNAALQANPPMLYNTSFGNVKDQEKLNQQAHGSGIIPVTNPDMVPLSAIAEYMQVPRMDGQAAGMYEALGAVIDSTTGVNDSFRGTQQASSGKEVQLQQEAAYTRIKTMIDQFELFNKRIAEKTIVNSMQFLNTTRGYRIKGDYRKYEQDEQEMGEEMPMEIKKITKGTNPETGEPVLDRSEFFLYANPNEWTKLKPDEEDMGEQGETAYKILQMTVEIEAGSSLPQSRLARREEAAELFSAGAIDQEALLDSYDWPDREEIIKRMQDAAAQQQEAQAAAAQAEAQAKVQVEQQKMELEKMKIEADMAKNTANNNAKLQQQQSANVGNVAEQGLENTGNGLAEVLDSIRAQFPGSENIPDEELIAMFQG